MVVVSVDVVVEEAEPGAVVPPGIIVPAVEEDMEGLGLEEVVDMEVVAEDMELELVGTEVVAARAPRAMEEAPRMAVAVEAGMEVEERVALKTPGGKRIRHHTHTPASAPFSP